MTIQFAQKRQTDLDRSNSEAELDFYRPPAVSRICKLRTDVNKDSILKS